MKPILETDRLNLIPFETADLQLLYQTLTDPFVRRYLMDDEIISYEKAQEFILINEQSFTKSRWGLWKLMLKEQVTYAGFAGLWCFFGEEQPQLLFALLPDQIKKGYANEASKAIIDYAFNKLLFKHIIAACDTPNTASKKVCEKLDMKQTEEKEINGHPTTFYQLLNAHSY